MHFVMTTSAGQSEFTQQNAIQQGPIALTVYCRMK